jgi:hypothetical protein
LAVRRNRLAGEGGVAAMFGDIHKARAAAYAAKRDAGASGASREEAIEAAKRAWDATIERTRGEER